MGPDISVDMAGKNVTIEIEPELYFSPAILTLDIGGTTIHLSGTDEQFAQIHEALGQHLQQREGIAS